MAKNSREIGKKAEREAAKLLNEILGTDFRRSQQYKGAADSSDLIDDGTPELSPEIKRRSDYSIKLHRAVAQARTEAADDSTAFVVHKLPREPWLLTVDLRDLSELVEKMSRKLAKKGGDR